MVDDEEDDDERDRYVERGRRRESETEYNKGGRGERQIGFLFGLAGGAES